MMPSKKKIKGKIHQFYELLETKEPMQLLLEKSDYWDEFFLLRPDCEVLQSMLKRSAKDTTKRVEPLVTLLFSQSIVALKEDSQVRIANALLTMCITARSTLYADSGPRERLSRILGSNDWDIKMDLLRGRLVELLAADSPFLLKSLILDLLLIFSTYVTDIHENPIMDHLMSDQLFDSLISCLSFQSRQTLGFKVVVLLTILLNYKRVDGVNPFVVKLSMIHTDVALNVFAHVISCQLCEHNKKYEEKCDTNKNQGGFFSALTSMVGGMLVADDEVTSKHSKGSPRDCLSIYRTDSNALLLALYHAIHLNRNFISLLINFTADPLDEMFTKKSFDRDSPNSSNSGLESSSSPTVTTTVSSESDVTSLPSNLLISFLEFFSIVILNTKDDSCYKTSRLCFIILTCISEDQCANAIMYDNNISFRVQLHRTPMRHRKMVNDSTKPVRPISSSVLDLMVEFILSNLRKSLPIDLYFLSLGVIHRLICYQKRFNIRFTHNWTDVWSALITLLKYLINHESELLEINLNIFSLASMTINIFNAFITYGDSFLPTLDTYDLLYYEIIRMHIVFENVYHLAIRYSASSESSKLDDELKESAHKLVPSLTNIRAIIAHFNPKIDSWSSSHEIESLTQEDVLEVVKRNYDTLTLKLQDGLDSYDSYCVDQVSSESDFFKQILADVISGFRESNCARQDYTSSQTQLLKEIVSQASL